MTDKIVLYRTYSRGYSKDKGAGWNSGYASTEFAESRIDVKIRLALKPEWLNTRLVEEKMLVPIGTKIHMGLVAPITLKTGTVLAGGAEQVLLPRNWPKDWIIGYREVTSKPLMIILNLFQHHQKIIVNKLNKNYIPKQSKTIL